VKTSSMKMISAKLYLILCITWAISIPNQTLADVYQCVGANGKVKYTDKPCKNTEQETTVKDIDLLKGRDSESPTDPDVQVGADQPALANQSNRENKKYGVGKLTEAPHPSSEFCSEVLSTGLHQTSTWIEAVERNYKEGRMPKIYYDQQMQELKVVVSMLTFKRCQNSVGKEKTFFECLNKYENGLWDCMKVAGLTKAY